MRKHSTPVSSAASERSSGLSHLEARASKTAGQKAIIVIGEHALTRDCLARSIQAQVDGHVVLSFASIKEWQEATKPLATPTVVMLCVSGRSFDAVASEQTLLQNLTATTSAPVVVISDAESVDSVLGALKSGARGYIPTSVTLDVAIEAMRLVEAGGTFVPASSLIGAAYSTNPSATRLGPRDRPFTVRQAEVLRALQRGKANKQIAHELKMRESTVKAHIRNLMKKLRARNRTEVVFLTSPSVVTDFADVELNRKS